MKKLLAYTLTCFLKSGNKVTAMLSANLTYAYRTNFIQQGSLDAVDIESNTNICVFKDAIDFVTFTPIYSKEETVGETDQDIVSESKGAETSTDNRKSDTGEVYEPDRKGC